MPERLIPFLGVVAVITILPGPDMALGIRNGVRGGRRATWLTGVGCLTGIAIWATASVLGLAAIITASQRAFDAVRVVGALYLAYLGLAALRSAITGREDSGGRLALTAARAQGERSVRVPARVWVRQGLVSNLLNPKIALLFITLLPQFVASGEPRTATTAELAGAFMLVSIVWWAVFSLAVGSVARLIARPAWRRGVEGAAGTVLVGLAARVLAAR